MVRKRLYIKIKAGKNHLRIQKGNLGILFQFIVSNFFYLAAEKNMRIITKIPLMTDVWFDSDKIEKILSNLLQNAIKCGKSGTDIQIASSIKEKQSYLKLSSISIQQLVHEYFRAWKDMSNP